MRKTVVVHIGPHKTGSTYIQQCLSQNQQELKVSDVLFLHNELTHSAALAIAAEQYDKASELLGHVAVEIAAASESRIIISQEDFSGNLPGRSPKRQIYPRLTKNLRVIARSLGAFDTSFLFFARDEREWIRSCYTQYLKYRTKFSNIEDFAAHFGEGFDWQSVLSRPKRILGDALQVHGYQNDEDAGVKAVLGRVDLPLRTLSRRPAGRQNSSPPSSEVAYLEHINRVSEFPQTAWFAKSLVLGGWSPNTVSVSTQDFQPWPPASLDGMSSPLSALLDRASGRVQPSQAPDILPPQGVNLNTLRTYILSEDAELPDTSRERMEDQADILRYHLRGKSELAWLNGLVISYLRRATPHTDKARVLFHRIWDEQGVLLVNELSTRWLISTLQTYLDHGKNEAQRRIGATGYFYANMMKIYEGERAIEGRDQNSVYAAKEPSTKNGFRGLDRFNLGGTDLMLNTNAIALEIALSDSSAGLVLQELLLRTKVAQTVFSRLDQSRIALDAEVPGFLDTWSFFEKPG